jgi:hypothetical protein
MGLACIRGRRDESLAGVMGVTLSLVSTGSDRDRTALLAAAQQRDAADETALGTEPRR